VAISPSGDNLLLFGSFDSTISVWKLNSSLDGKNEYECVTILEGHENEVKSVDFHPEESIVASCSRDKSVWLWDFDDELEFECLETLTEHDQDVKMVKWVPYNYTDSQHAKTLPKFRKKMLASASYDDTIKVYTVDEDGEYHCF
jgi:cytosolic iron-sulfur protein assembly protein CIAO1